MLFKFLIHNSCFIIPSLGLLTPHLLWNCPRPNGAGTEIQAFHKRCGVDDLLVRLCYTFKHKMSMTKKLSFALISATFLFLFPISEASAESGRFFIKSSSNFWKTALGARHNFNNGFSAELSDFQFRFAKLFGIKIDPVDVLNILEDTEVKTKSDDVLAETPLVDLPNLPTVRAASASEGTPIDTSGNNNKGKSPSNQRTTPSDQTPWGVEVVYDDPSVALTSGGLGVNVAVLDTGVFISHPDLINRIEGCKDFTDFRKPIIDGKCEDKNGHGTHVAGIIAGDAGSDGLGIYGIAPMASISAFRVCGNNGSCFADDIAAAIIDAADNNVNIINMSFGSDSNSGLIKNAIDYAVSRGVLMVAAAGNDGPFIGSIDYPAAYLSVVGVGGVDPLLAVAEWSSRGSNSETEEFVVEEGDIEFAMPGENIESAWPVGGYTILSGTSMAAPFLTGLAAKYWQADDEDPAGATRKFLQSLAEDINEPGDDDASGFGLPRVK